MKKTTIFVLLLAFSAATTAYAAEPNLVAWWKLDETSGNIAHDSAGSNSGTVYGAQWTTGQIGGALSFDGINNYVEMPDALSLRPGYITMSAWVKPQKTYITILEKSRFSDARYEQYSFGIFSNGKPQSDIKRNSACTPGVGWVVCNGDTVLENDGWYMITTTWDGITLKMYVNGQLDGVSTSAPPGPIDNCAGGTLRIGCHWSSDPAWYRGVIDDVRIYNKALSAEEVAQLYVELAIIKINTAIDENIKACQMTDSATEKEDEAMKVLQEMLVGKKRRDFDENLKKKDILKALQELRGAKLLEIHSEKMLDKSIDKLESALENLGVEPPPQFDPNLIAWWKLDETDGTIAHDFAGSNHGTLYGGPVWTTGQIDGALSLDGVDDYVSTASVAMTNTTNITMAGWIYWRAVSADSILFYNGDTRANGYGVFISNGNCAIGNKITVLLGGKSCNAVSSSTILPTNVWTHIALTREATAWKLYVNGVYKHTGTTNPNIPSGNALIGAGSDLLNPNFFNGIIDEVRFYNRALSATEVLQLYQEGL